MTFNTDALGELKASNEFVPYRTGYYEIEARAQFTGSGTIDRLSTRLRDRPNGTGVRSHNASNQGTNDYPDVTLVTTVELTAGNTYAIEAADVTNAATLDNGENTTFGMIRWITP